MTDTLKYKLSKSEDIPLHAENDIIRLVTNWLLDKRDQLAYPETIEWFTITLLLESIQ